MVTASNLLTQTDMRYSSQQFQDLQRLFDATYQYELHNGTIVKMAPSSMMPSVIAARILGCLSVHLSEHGTGYLTGADGAYVLSEANTFAPDVGYISYARQPDLIEQGFVPNAPDLTVEVLSPTDDEAELRRKAEIYLQHGTHAVWLVFPVSQTVDVYQPEKDVQTLKVIDTLTGNDLLPDFSLPLARIFTARHSTDTGRP